MMIGSSSEGNAGRKSISGQALADIGATVPACRTIVDSADPVGESPGLPMEPYDLTRLGDEGAELDEILAFAWLEERLNLGVEHSDLRFTPTRDGQAKLNLREIDPDSDADPIVRVTGKITAGLTCACVRCLHDLAVPVAAKLDMTFFPKTVEDRELNEDEGTYDNMELDLPEIVREAILLAVDMNPSCEDEDACGARTRALMERAGVLPEEDAPDPRWAALKNIQLD